MEQNYNGDLKMTLVKADICELLAISLRNPDINLVEGLLSGSYLYDASDLLAEIGTESVEINQMSQKIGQYLSEEEESSLLSKLRQEYTRLFSDPQKPAVEIYETTFRYHKDGQGDTKPALFISEAALDAERQYKAAGLILTTSVREPADHLATEFEFMMYLYTQKAIAIQQGDEEQQSIREKQIKEFTETHLSRWLSDFANTLTLESGQEFYNWLAAFMTTCLKKL